MTGWIPRPPHPDEPVCWSWPVPPLLDKDAEVARILAEQAALPIGHRSSEAALRMRLYDMAVYRYRQFHADRCAICGVERLSCGGQMVTDHCHLTGQWRGELCKPCNSREGRSLKPSPPIARYRRIHPAAILDLHEPYDGTGWTWGWSWREYGYRVHELGFRPATPWPVWSPDDPLELPPLPQQRASTPQPEGTPNARQH